MTTNRKSRAEQNVEAKRRIKRRGPARGPGRVHLHHNVRNDGGEDDSDGASVERASYSIKEFCRAYRISEALYFKMKREGKGPRELHVGGRVIISIEAAANWQREREAETAAAV
jgi:hypothetical protein